MTNPVEKPTTVTLIAPIHFKFIFVFLSYFHKMQWILRSCCFRIPINLPRSQVSVILALNPFMIEASFHPSTYGRSWAQYFAAFRSSSCQLTMIIRYHRNLVVAIVSFYFYFIFRFFLRPNSVLAIIYTLKFK